MRDITRQQRFGLNALMEGMKFRDFELSNGGVVNNHVNAIRGLIELIAKAAAEKLKT